MSVTLKNYKFSDLDVDFCKQYLKIDWDDDDIEINLYLESAKSFVMQHSEKTEEELDEITFSTICVMKLVSDFYHNRMSHNSVSYGVDNFLKEMLLKIRTYNLGGLNV